MGRTVSAGLIRAAEQTETIAVLSPRRMTTGIMSLNRKVDALSSNSALRLGHVGLFLIAVSWPANWLLPGLRTHLWFAPLWIGFAITIDALVYRRTGTSIISRSPRTFATLFLLSAPAWWLFELFNLRTQNWMYQGVEHFGSTTFFVLATIAFTTVMPAVFEAAELIRSYGWVQRFKRGPRLRLPASLLLLLGLAFVALILIWPAYFYPLVWGAVLLLTEPVNQWSGRRSLLDHVARGDWRLVLSLSGGALVCGFFWEFWNYWSYPKWTYSTPGADFWHVFEMPLLGYFGYVPFGLELFALATLLGGDSVSRVLVSDNNHLIEEAGGS